MVVTGVTAMQPLMSSGHLAACREPWVMTKVCTPPHTCLEAFTPGHQPSAGFGSYAASSKGLTQRRPSSVLDL